MYRAENKIEYTRRDDETYRREDSISEIGDIDMGGQIIALNTMRMQEGRKTVRVVSNHASRMVGTAQEVTGGHV